MIILPCLMTKRFCCQGYYVEHVANAGRAEFISTTQHAYFRRRIDTGPKHYLFASSLLSWLFRYYAFEQDHCMATNRITRFANTGRVAWIIPVITDTQFS